MTESHFRPFNDKHFVTVSQSLFERTLLKGRLIERGADRQLEKKNWRTDNGYNNCLTWSRGKRDWTWMSSIRQTYGFKLEEIMKNTDLREFS